MRDVGATVQGIFQIGTKKSGGDCNVDTNQDMEVTLTGFCFRRTEELGQILKVIKLTYQQF